MALRNPPSWLQNGSHPAENDRLTTNNILFTSAGVANLVSMVVSQAATPSMSVQVAAGHAVVAGSETATQGYYTVYNDAAVTLSVATASPSLPRIDRVVVAVQDAYYSGSNNQVVYQVVTGTPNASPVAPTAPANSLTLATIAVAAGATSIVNGNITDARVQAQFTESAFMNSIASSNTVLVNGIAGQTGKAIRVNNSSGTQTFGVAVDGTVTFQDGTTQTSAAYYNPNLNINAQSGTTYSLVVGDAQKLVTLSNASPITLTIESNATQALPVGTQVSISQFGAGQVTVVGASSPNPVTVNATPGLKLRAQYSTATLIQVSTDNWLMIGDLSA